MNHLATMYSITDGQTDDSMMPTACMQYDWLKMHQTAGDIHFSK